MSARSLLPTITIFLAPENTFSQLVQRSLARWGKKYGEGILEGIIEQVLFFDDVFLLVSLFHFSAEQQMSIAEMWNFGLWLAAIKSVFRGPSFSPEIWSMTFLFHTSGKRGKSWGTKCYESFI